MNYLEKGSTSDQRIDVGYHMPGTEIRASAHRHRSAGAHLTHLLDHKSPPDARRLPESSRPVAGEFSSASKERASRLLAGTSWSRAAVRRLAAGLLLVVAGLLGVSTAAHAQTTLVSNTGQDNSGARGVGRDDYAQAFGTGSITAGYDLDSIVLSLGGAPTGTGTLTVTVREDASGDPSGTALYTLTTPDPIVGDALNTFPAPAGATLDANTTYWVVASYSSDSGGPNWWRVDLSDGIDSGGASGWTIDSPFKTNDRDNPGGWAVVSSSRGMKLQVKGTAKGTTILSTDATLSALALSGVTLDSPFAPATQDYTATVGNSVMQTTVTATTAHSGATVALKYGDDTPLTNPVTLAVGANVIKAVVTAEDTTTMKTYMVTVTREATTDTPVTIEAEYESIGAGLEDLLFTLTREGETTDALDVTVTITQAQPWLSNLEYTVTFPANSATAELTITASNFSFTPSTTGDLTATVSGDGIDGGSDTVKIISTSEPPFTASYDMPAYTFAEDATDEAIYLVVTLDAAYPRAVAIDAGSFSSRGGTATSPEDFIAYFNQHMVSPGEFTRDVDTDPLVARSLIPDFIVPDDIYEGSESFGMKIEAGPGLSTDLLQFAYPDGTTCAPYSCSPGVEYPVTITDEGDLPALSLSVDPPSIAEEDDDGTTSVAENVSTVTVEITNPPKTYAVDQTATLSFSGTATQGTHYSVSPGDADTNTAGHQVVLVKETASVEVTVTATANDTDDGPRTVTVAADLDGTAIGSRGITILDDDTTTPTTVPGAPTSLTATANGTTTIDLSWTAPADNGGSPITGYRIEVSPNGTSSWTNRVANTGTTTTTYAHTGLSAGTTRHYRVSAINANGTGAASTTDNATTDDAATTVPGAPTSLTATANGTTTIDLSWTAPADDGGSAITGYRIEVSPDGTSSWSNRVADTGTTTTTYAHTGLSAGTTRYYRVSAINATGTGAASTTDNATTDDAATTVPGAPTSLTATASGTTTIDLSWTAPADDGGSAITGYRIEVSPDGTSSWSNRVADTGTTATTYAHTGLSAGTTRHYRVSAINATGTGAASSTDNATTGTTTDTGPLTLTVEAVEATVTEGEPVRYRIRMSRRTPGAVVQSSFRYQGNFVRNPNSVVTSGINSHGGRLSWVVSYDTLDDVVVEADGKFTVTIRKPDSTLTGGADLYSHGEEYTVGSPSSATVTIVDNDGAGAPPPPSPPIVSAEDARVAEGPGAELVFPVTLDRAPVETARIDWQTLDDANRTGATAGQDYVAASGTLEFRPGQTSKTIRVAVLDDSHDEGNEVMLLYLTGAEHAVIDDALLKGTIENSDPLPRALMGRFGRTAALHVVERVEARMAAPRTVGVEGRVAGRQVRPGMERELALDVLRQLGASAGRPAPAGSMALGAGMGRPASGALGLAAGPMDGRASPDGGLFDRGLASLGLGGGHLLTGSSVAVTRETRHGGLLSFWSRGARSSFAGREGALRLDGDVRTTMVGADYATGPLIVGVSLAHSRGLGGYTGVDIGEVHSSVTGLYPWLGYTVSDRVSVWGVTGYGTGTLALTPGEAPALTSGLSMGMAAGGLRGDLAESVVAGFGLAFKADALWVGTAIDGVAGPGGNLAATEAAVTRVRTGLEASRGYRFQRGVSLTPRVEVGLRHDGGDAERGTGLDVGAGVIVSDTSTGLAVDVRVRMLLVHQAEGFRERGASVSLSYNPTPSTPLGLTARVAPSWGGQATSGAEALWGRETMAGLAPGAGAHGTRLAAAVGYGLPVGRRFVGTPTVGVGTAADGRDYRLGYRLGALGGAGTTVELGVEAQRRERPRQAGTDHGARARATLRW